MDINSIQLWGLETFHCLTILDASALCERLKDQWHWHIQIGLPYAKHG